MNIKKLNIIKPLILTAFSFFITSISFAQEIELAGGLITISNGGNTPIVADSTDFGAIAVATTNTNVFTINNVDAGNPLLLNGTPLVTVIGNSFFTVSTQPANTTIVASGNETFEITYSPTTSGIHTATVIISSDDADDNPYTFTIQGTATGGPEMDVQGLLTSITNGDVTPSGTDDTDFGSIAVAATNTNQFTILNTDANNPLNLTGSPIVSISGNAFFTVSAQPGNTSIAAAGNETFDIDYSPTTSGIHTATVIISSDDSDENPYTFTIQGSATGGPEMDVQGLLTSITNGDVTPSGTDDTDFGSIAVAATNTNQFTILNTDANNPLNLTGSPIVLVSGNANFSVSAQPSASSIAAASSLTFDIDYTPTTSGTHTATVIISNDDSDENPYTFTIQGTAIGQEINVTGAGFNILDGEITPTVGQDTDFGNTTTGTPVVHTFTIENETAATTLNITGINIGGVNSGDFTLGGITFPENLVGVSNTTFTISFDPLATGIRFAEISIVNDDDNENPYNFIIQGNGLTPQEIDIHGNGVSIIDGDDTPDGGDDTDFGNVAESGFNTNINTFTIFNTGEEALDINNIAISGTNAADFSLTSIHGFPETISGLNSNTFDITFNPSAPGVRTATITITNTDGNEGVYNFDVQGNGTTSSNVKISDNPNSSVLCSGTITDSDARGDNDYDNNENYTYTIQSTNANRIGIKFISDALFQIESGGSCGGSSCTCDYLEVNYGPSTGIVRYCDANKPDFGVFLYGDPGADIVLHFVSDGGVDKDGFTIDWESRINANVTTTDVSCFGDNDGIVTITPSPGTAGHGTAGYQHNLDGAGLDPITSVVKSFTGLTPGAHTLSITDLNGCLFDTTVTISQPATTLVISEMHTDENCAGSADGTLTLSASGGTVGGGYTYSFNNGPFTSTTNYTGISDGNFPIAVMDANGCTNSSNVVFNVGSGGAPTGTPNISGDAFFCLTDNSDHPFNVTGVTGAGSYSWTFYGITPTALPIINSGQGSSTIVCNMSAVTDSLYLVVDASNACGNLTPDTIVVYPSEVDGSFVMNPTDANATIDSIYLGGLGQPIGGVYSGGSVTPATPEFNPNAAGVGNHSITYTFTDANSCVHVYTDDIDVATNAGFFTGLSSNYCHDYDASAEIISATESLIEVTPTNTSSASSRRNIRIGYNIDGGSTGISGQAVNLCIIDPGQLSHGTHSLNYEYYQEGLTFNFATFTYGLPWIQYGSIQTVTTTFFVDSIGPVNITGVSNSFTSINEYCIDPSNQFQVLGHFNHPDGFGSFSYSGPAGSFSTVSQSSSALITAQDVGSHNLQFTYTSNLTGCTSDSVETILIHDLPTLNFDILSDYCTNDNSVLVVGNPLGGTFNGNGTIIVDTNYTTKDSIDFSPINTAGGVPHTLTYSFTDANQCFNSVDSVFTMHIAPTVQFDNDTLRTGYCELTDPSYPVTGLINGSNINQGYFWGPGITDVDSTDGSAQFITNNVAVGSGYEIYYSYTDANNCSNIDTAVVDIYPLPVVTLENILTNQYCNNHNIVANPIQFFGTPSISSGIAGTFILDDDTTSADQSNFDPTDYPSAFQDTIHVSYTHTNSNGCINEAIDTVYVNPQAYPTFSIDGFCIVDPIDFTDLTIPTPNGLNAWSWTVGDSIYNTQNPSHQFISEGNHSINLQVTTNQNCVSDTTISAEFGNKPVADFYWINECFDLSDPVMFFDASNTVSSLDTLNFDWTFGDGGIDSIPDVNYQYLNSGDYNVQLVVKTNFNCIDTVTKLVSVKPYINSYPYYTNFQNGPDSWTAKTIIDNDTINSWAHSTFILDNNTSNLSWSTSNLIDSSDYHINERTYVSSPCYDFTSLQKPMIRFNIWRDFSDIGDGAVLESSIDNGQTWQVIGNEQSTDAGINWYNQVVINNGDGPGGDLLGGQPIGWSNIKDTKWFEVRHELDHLIGNSKVIFRLAFSTNAAGEDKGFAFDNVWIGERSKYVLVEHFTSTTCSPCAITSNSLNPFIEQYNKDIIDIQYQSNAIVGNILYDDYQAGPSTRELYYGASQLPQTITDGNILNETTSSWISDSLETRRRALTSAIFDIDLTKTITGNDITLDATITAGQNFTDEVDVYIAVIEKEITDNGVTNAGGTILSGESEFKNVVKAMLPDAGGTRISTPWTTGDTQTISETFNSLNGNFYDIGGSDDLEMVIFIQNAATKEIYQTATTDVSFIDIIIGVDEENENEIERAFSFNLYPNPTSGKLFLMFNQNIKKNTQVHIFNELGSLVEKRDLSNGIGSSFSTEKYSEGIYFMSIVYEGQRFTKRFMVIK